MLFRNPVTVLMLLVVALAGCDRKQSYSRDVRPVLQKHCIGCHSPGEKGYKASGFSVESYASLMRGTKYGPVIIPGDSEASSLMLQIQHDADPTLNMPQEKDRLPEVKLAAIRDWINQGAIDN